MTLEGLNHVNIGCRRRDLPAIEKFYGDVLGLKSGFRPPFPNEGLWLYQGRRALLHITARFPDHWVGRPDDASFDHIAFSLTGVDEVRARLTHLGVAFDQQNVPDAGFQLFLRDPVGNKVELNFPNAEAPQSVASGTLAAMQFPERAGKRV